MINKFLTSLKAHEMLKEGDRVCVGLSGGADSVSLLHLLFMSKDELGISLSAVHINHGIRGEEAKRDEDFSKDFCKSLGIDCLIYHIDVPSEAEKTGEGCEECARRLRYQIFESLDCDKIATAHNLNDNIETFFFNLTRGASLSGLCGIPYKRGKVIRPLLDISREEIEKYILENGLSFVTDSTNLQDDYTRNKIRHNILPRFYELNPAFDKSFHKCITSLNMTNAYIDKTASVLIENAELEDGYDISKIKDADPVIKNQVYKKILKENGAMNIIREHIWAVSHIADKGGSADVCGLRVNVDRDIMTFGKKEEITDFEIRINIDDEYVDSPLGRIYIKKYKSEDLQNLNKQSIKYMIDCDKINGSLSLRNRIPGDCIKLPKRGTKTLKQLFNEKKIPIRERQKLFLIADDDGLIMLEKFGADARASVTDSSKNYIYISRSEDL